MVGNRPPVVDSRATERIDPQADLCAANCVHVENVGKIADVAMEIIAPVRGGGVERPCKRYALHAVQAGPEEFIGLRLDPAGGNCVRRAAMGLVILEASILRRIV